MSVGHREMDSGSAPSSLRRSPDVVLIVGWLLACAILGFSRKDFTGDGIRHLAPILELNHPQLGEPRWLFFPTLLFLLLKPFALLHLATTTEQLTRPMMAMTLIAAAVYMFGVRSCLTSLGVPARRRAVGLLVAAFTAGLLFAATDLMEPIFAAALVTIGLAVAAHRQTLAAIEERRRGVIIAIGLIAIASTLYQGVVLAVGLLPMFLHRKTIDRRTVAVSLAILVAVPIASTAVLVLAGNSVGHAFERLAQGEENPQYRTYLKKSGLEPTLSLCWPVPLKGL